MVSIDRRIHHTHGPALALIDACPACDNIRAHYDAMSTDPQFDSVWLLIHRRNGDARIRGLTDVAIIVNDHGRRLAELEAWLKVTITYPDLFVWRDAGGFDDHDPDAPLSPEDEAEIDRLFAESGPEVDPADIDLRS